MMSADCKAKCPEVMTFLTDVSSAGEDGMMDAICKHLTTLTCIAENSVCQDEGSKELTDNAGMMGCVCDCPAVMNSDIEMEGQALSAEDCKIVKCVKGADGCKALMDSADANAKKSMDSCDGGSSSDHAATQA